MRNKLAGSTVTVSERIVQYARCLKIVRTKNHTAKQFYKWLRDMGWSEKIIEGWVCDECEKKEGDR